MVEGVTLKLVKNHAVRWVSGMPVHGDPSHVSDPALGRAVAETLGPHHALQIRAHGQVIAAESVPGVLIDSVHFVENAVAMYQAAALGKVMPLTEKEIAGFLHDFKRDRHIPKLWKYYVGRGRDKGLLPAKWDLSGTHKHLSTSWPGLSRPSTFNCRKKKGRRGCPAQGRA